ncbi:Sec-independent protein translocase protein TatB [Oceanisphaera sp. IT1-181]|uniref:Sec-independent protein translocase protein TatB n=1 Tax=Oceanisphaera sp. IT1-181 TaxID=3081199 RepID=UPI0029CA1444|nr:Sec-independent protein translocase protein TatB [Oceanisphaera sp. IT1-181]
MFDIGFWELVVIAVVGLLVLGPERLPVAIRTVSRLFKTVRDTANAVKTELSQELRMEELHRDLKKAEQLDIKHLSPELKESVDQLREAAASVTRPYEKKALPKAHQPVPDAVQEQKSELDQQEQVQEPQQVRDDSALSPPASQDKS